MLDTFRVNPVAETLCGNVVPAGPLGTERWLAVLRGRVDCELVRVKDRSTLTREYRQRQQQFDSTLVDLRGRPSRSVPEPVPVRVKLSESHRAAVRERLRRPDDSVVVSKFSIDFCVRDLRTLVAPNWLNDEVINFYCQLLVERSLQGRGRFPLLHAFSSFFFPKLRERGYAGVRTATRRQSPPTLARDLLLVPVHLGMHWCMASIDFRSRAIAYHDSLHGDNAACLRALREWIAGEFEEKNEGRQFDFTGWTESCPKDVPAQRNGYDCGVFALVLAEHLSRDAAPIFAQADMPYWRERISYEIISGKLLEY